jgi:predicted RecB family nuclease
MAWLTKSRFLSGLQCHRRLWFEIHEPLEEPLPDSVAFISGRAVDLLVQTLHPGVVVSRERGMPAAIGETARLMRQGAPAVLYQPAFRSGDLAVIADVLRRRGDQYTLIEVKSSTAVRPEHLPDVGFQALVLRAAKIPVERVVLAHVDRSFVLKTQGDYAGLIAEQDVTSEVEAALPQIAESAAVLQEVMASTRRPGISMGAHCTSPYECPFIERCRALRGPAAEYPVELLPRGGKIVDTLLAEGHQDLMSVPAGRLKGAIHLRVHQATVSGQAFFDAGPTEPLRKLIYPMAHLDFETIGLAVPEIIGTRPYEQLPFQFSVHVEESEATVRHAQFLAIADFGDQEALARALLAALPDSGPVFAYNASFERGVLLGLADRVPGLANNLRDIAARLVDLLPITRSAYYHPGMKGSWSIKHVLRTLAPELDYSALADVQEGGEAQLAFLQILGRALSAERQEQLRTALLRYCERDTWGMVVLRRFLCGATTIEMI